MIGMAFLLGLPSEGMMSRASADPGMPFICSAAVPVVVVLEGCDPIKSLSEVGVKAMNPFMCLLALYLYTIEIAS